MNDLDCSESPGGVHGCGDAVTITNSRFHGIGRGGREHPVYAGTKECKTVVVKDSQITDIRSGSNGIKSSAAHTKVVNTDITCAKGTTPIGTYKGGKVEAIGGTFDMSGECNAQLVQYGDGARKAKRWPVGGPFRYDDNSVVFDGVNVKCGKRSYLLRVVEQARDYLDIPDPAAITTVRDVSMDGCKGVIQ